ncbi:MAG: DUF5689 domain-containing protein [Marinilabiliaceae bacterium]|nr:DUF5689 domain-containing protein [Marinilabiliaceae bacterium]
MTQKNKTIASRKYFAFIGRLFKESQLICQALLTLLIIIGVASCYDKEFDLPPYDAPIYEGKANISIKDFKQKFDSNLKRVDSTFVIGGIVVANDKSGNIYKQIFIQDSTGGLCIAIDKNNLYNDFRVGQKVFIETEGLYMGKYGGLPQLGYTYIPIDSDVERIGQAPWTIFRDKIFTHGFPDTSLVNPIVITFSDLRDEFLSCLVTFESVSFEDAGHLYSFPSEDGRIQTLNRDIFHSESANEPNKPTVTTRMSSAADFAAQIIPHGIGKVTGVLTRFNNTPQLLVRDSTDINFEHNPDGWGTKGSPWTVEYALKNMDKNKQGWVKGVIVGTTAPGINENNPVTTNADILFDNTAYPFSRFNIVIAENANIRDWQKCIVVNLPDLSDMQTELNLRENPDIIGCEVTILGDLKMTLGAAGIEVSRGTKEEYIFDNPNSPVILEAPFRTTLSPFTQYTVTGTQTWYYSSLYQCAYMSGYVSSNNNANEDWLISPSINLTNNEKAHINFHHAHRFGNPTNDFTLWISSNYSSGNPNSVNWTQINIINYSAGTSYDFVDAGNLNIPDDFTGKNNIRIAFKYLSTNTSAGTWEIRDFILKSGPADGETNENFPVLTTLAATNVTNSSATLGGNISFVGNPEYTERGVCYSTSQNPTTSDFKIIVPGSGAGDFSASASGLSDNTTYYVRAYAINSEGTAYGNQISFATDEGNAEVIFLETFGTGSYLSSEPRPKVNVFTDFDETGVVFHDPFDRADIRSLASGNNTTAHVWFPTGESKLIISNIDVSGYSNVKLSYFFSAGANTSDKLIVKVNDVPLTVPVVSITQNNFQTINIAEPITSAGVITIEFHATPENNTVGFRLDNIKLTGEAK